MEDTIAARAKENKEQSGKDYGIGKVPQISAKPITPIETREEIAKLAGVSRDTVDKVNPYRFTKDSNREIHLVPNAPEKFHIIASQLAQGGV